MPRAWVSFMLEGWRSDEYRERNRILDIHVLAGVAGAFMISFREQCAIAAMSAIVRSNGTGSLGMHASLQKPEVLARIAADAWALADAMVKAAPASGASYGAAPSRTARPEGA